MNDVFFAFLLTLFAGLATGIGSILAIFVKTTNTKFLSLALGLSAGVMIYVSMVEILFKANEALTTSIGVTGGSWLTVAGFFIGMFFMMLIDKLIPGHTDSNEEKNSENKKLL